MSGPYVFSAPEMLLHQRVRWAQLRLDRSTDRVLSRIGLSAAKFYVLVILGRVPDQRLTPTQIGARMVMERSNLTAILDRMERDNLCVREPNPLDRRSLMIRLTDEGREKLDEASELYSESISTIVRGLSPAELQRVVDLLTKLEIAEPGIDE